VLVWDNCTQYCKTDKGFETFQSCVSYALKDAGYSSGALHLAVGCGKAQTSGQSRNRVGWFGGLLAMFVIIATTQ
jgi:hypothetical protein